MSVEGALGASRESTVSGGRMAAMKAALRRMPVMGRFADAAAAALGDVAEARWRRERRKIFAAYLMEAGPHKLHLGAGRVALEGWLNTDIEPWRAPGLAFLDACEPFPFPDGVFDAVFSEHMIEHIDHGAGLRMLRECRRVLKPGSVIRVSTPDLATLLGLYGRPLGETERRYLAYVVKWTIPDAPADPVFVINNNFRNWGHRFLYDEATLRTSLSAAGFVEVNRRAANESAYPDLSGVDSHGRAAGHEDMAAFESMALEARRT